MAHGGGSSWLAEVGDPLLRNWIIPVRNVSVDVHDCGTRKCTTLLLHGLREARQRRLEPRTSRQAPVGRVLLSTH